MPTGVYKRSGYCRRGLHAMSAGNTGADGGCKDCSRARKRTSETKFANSLYNAKEEVKNRKREHSLLPQSKAAQKAYRESPEGIETRARLTAVSRQKSTGWSIGAFEKALVDQGNACDICKEPFLKTSKRNTPHADHVHIVPPKPRGILCNNCNNAIGLLKDDPRLCEEAAVYLRKWE